MMTDLMVKDADTEKWFDGMREHYLVSPLHAHFGLTLDAVEDGKVVVGLNGKREFLNAYDVMAGSVITGMIDSALLQAVKTRCGAGDFLTTLEIKVNFLAPAKGTKFRCEAKVIHAGGSTGVAYAVVTDQDGTAVASGMGTIFIRRKAKV
jgi:uncharacterized protein (TIGR00369 family)